MAQGCGAEDVLDWLGERADDSAVAALARARGWVVMTKDRDFGALGCRSVRLRCGNATNRRLIAWLEPRWSDVVRAARSRTARAVIV